VPVILRALVMFAAGASLLAGAQQTPIFKAATETVPIYATVQDRNGRLVPDLTRDDFEVFDSGKPVAITVFSNEIQPITVVVLLDMSGSMANRLLRVREGALHFIRALRPEDRARIGTFGEEIAISPWLTNDKIRLERILGEELWPGGATPLWGGLSEALRSLDSETGRRVVLTLTDGVAAGSLQGYDVGRQEVERRTLAGGFMIYAIGLAGGNRIPSTVLAPALDPQMVQLVARTGGGHFELANDDDLETTFSRVAEELRRQYLLGIVQASSDGKTRSIEVRTRNRDLSVRARRSYVAGAAR
jgi:Ca-activated chloride channel family protein